MITPEQHAEIRRLYYREHWKVGTIAAALAVHHDTVRAAIAHDTRASVSGTWKSPLSDGTTRSGTVGGTLTTTSFSGAFTYHRTLTDGTNCDGTLTVSGPAGGNSLTWTSPGVSENCSNPATNITITVVKQ